MSRDLWVTDTAEHDTAYGMAYEFRIDPDGRFWDETSQPEPDAGWDDEDGYDRDGER